MSNGKVEAKSAVVIAGISALSAIVVAWITAGGVARGATENKIEESGSALGQISRNIEQLESRTASLGGELSGLPVGSVISSLLAPGEFARQVSDPSVFDPSATVWVVADGSKDGTRSAYERITGRTVVPDLRGLFLRGINLGRSDGYQDPAGERAPGDFQADELKSHSHPLDQGIGRSGGWAGGWGGQQDQRAVNGPGDRAMKVLSSGGKESRPRNAAVYYYIKIN